MSDWKALTTEKILALMLMFTLINVGICGIWIMKSRNIIYHGGATFRLAGLEPNQMVFGNTDKQELLFIPAYRSVAPLEVEK